MRLSRNVETEGQDGGYIGCVRTSRQMKRYSPRIMFVVLKRRLFASQRPAGACGGHKQPSRASARAQGGWGPRHQGDPCRCLIKTPDLVHCEHRRREALSSSRSQILADPEDLNRRPCPPIANNKTNPKAPWDFRRSPQDRLRIICRRSRRPQSLRRELALALMHRLSRCTRADSVVMQPRTHIYSPPSTPT